MNSPDDLNDKLQEARELTDDDARRERELEFELVWDAMSDAEREHWIGVLIRMYDEERRRLN